MLLVNGVVGKPGHRVLELVLVGLELVHVPV